jgi:hypothetical protein
LKTKDPSLSVSFHAARQFDGLLQSKEALEHDSRASHTFSCVDLVNIDLTTSGVSLTLDAPFNVSIAIQVAK